MIDFDDDATELEKKRAKAHAIEHWGELEVVIQHFKGFTTTGRSWPEMKPKKHKIAPSWLVSVFLGPDRVLESGRCRTKEQARARARNKLRAKLDRLPARIDYLETLHTALMGALR